MSGKRLQQITNQNQELGCFLSARVPISAHTRLLIRRQAISKRSRGSVWNSSSRHPEPRERARALYQRATGLPDHRGVARAGMGAGVRDLVFEKFELYRYPAGRDPSAAKRGMN